MSLTTPGNILFVKNFDFGDGTNPKNKIIIVFHEDNNSITVINSLTTSQNNIKEIVGQDLHHGCYNGNGRNIHFYFYDKNINVGISHKSKEQFKFRADTFVHLREVHELSSLQLLKYKRDITILAKLHDYELKSIINCIISSKFVANKIKTVLKKVV